MSEKIVLKEADVAATLRVLGQVCKATEGEGMDEVHHLFVLTRETLLRFATVAVKIPPVA